MDHGERVAACIMGEVVAGSCRVGAGCGVTRTVGAWLVCGAGIVANDARGDVVKLCWHGDGQTPVQPRPATGEVSGSVGEPGYLSVDRKRVQGRLPRERMDGRGGIHTGVLCIYAHRSFSVSLRACGCSAVRWSLTKKR